MIDLATLQQVALATGGTRGYLVTTSSDGRVFISQSHQVDVLNPIEPPLVANTNPPPQSIVALPLGSVTVTFNEDMLVGQASNPHSVLNPANYQLIGSQFGAVTFTSITYNATTRTVTLNFDNLNSDNFTLNVLTGVENSSGLELAQEYTTTFQTVTDFSSLVNISFTAGRANNVTKTTTYNLVVTNLTHFNLVVPLILYVDSLQPTTASLVGGMRGTDINVGATGGQWWLNLSTSISGGGTVLIPGGSTISTPFTIYDPAGTKISFKAGVFAMPLDSVAPVFTSTPITTTAVGSLYQYQVSAYDPNGGAISYVLASGPPGMNINAATGMLSWAPTLGSAAQTSVSVQAYNQMGGHATQTFTIAVSGVSLPPVFGALANQFSGQVGQSLQIQVSATDINVGAPSGASGYPLTYWADNLPPGATFNSFTQTLSWDPIAGQAGTYPNINFFATDGFNQVMESTTVVIAPTLQAPTLAVPPTLMSVPRVLEGENIHFTLQASEPPASQPGLATLTYSSSMLPGGAGLDPNTGVFDWTPGYDQHGVYQIPFTASDGQMSTTVTATFAVVNVNAPPVFNELGNWSIPEGQNLEFRAFAFDPNNPGYVPQEQGSDGTLTPPPPGDPPATITYTVSGLPSGASFNPQAAMFTWTPAYGEAGNYVVTFTATNNGDGTGVPKSATVQVPITVLKTYRAPELTFINNQTVDEGTTLTVPVQATDLNGEALTLSTVGLPAFGAFVDNGNGTGLFTFAPGPYDRGNTTLTITASDAGDGIGPAAVESTSQSFVVTVNNPSLPPKLIPLGNKVAVVGQPLQFTVQASDGDQQPLTFAALGLPGTATLTPSSVYGQAVINWTPTAADIGQYSVLITVTNDGNGNTSLVQSAEQSFTLVVRTSDQAPMWLPVINPTLAAGQPLSLQLQAIDPDGDQVTYSASNLPLGASLNPLSGLLTWTPSLVQAGTYSGIILSASDGDLTVTQTPSIIVTKVNQAPQFIPLQPQSGREGTQMQFTLAAADLNGLTPTYSVITGQPAGATFDASSGLFQWDPNYGQAGHYVVTFGASDSTGLSSSLPVEIVVDKTFRAPTLQATNHSVVVGQPFRFQLIGTDLDAGTTLTYSAVGMPDGATLDPGSGVFQWTPGPTQTGDFVVQFTASDGTLSVTEPVVLQSTISPVLPQVLVTLTPSFPDVPGSPVLIHVTASSFAPIAGMTLSVNGQSLPLDSHGRASYTPAVPGQYALSATATDDDGLVGQYSTVLKVRDPNDTGAPVVTLSPSLQNARLTQLTSIVGSVSDTNLDYWTLELAPNGSSAFTKLAGGTASVASSTLAQLDPTMLANGPYLLELTAANISGKVTTVTDLIEIDSTSKSIQYLSTAVDLTTQLGGSTVSLTRQYDSLMAGQSGTFGYGWRLTNTDVDIQTNVMPTGAEAQGIYNPFAVGTRLYLTLPNGNRAGFTFTPVAHQQGGVTYYTPAWTADPGVNYTLSSAYDVMTLAVTRYYDLETAQPYNPASGGFAGPQYTLTGPDGTVYYLNTQNGVQEEVLPGGATLTFSQSGIVSSTGQSIIFVHDAQGRLTTAIAPDGTCVVYSYDANGNLVSARNIALGQSNQYGYSSGSQHLLEINVQPGGPDSAIQYSPSPTVFPLTDLGTTGQFVTTPAMGTLVAGTTDRYAFVLTPSELAGTASGTVFIGVQVQAAAGSSLQPGVPQIPGLAPSYSSSTPGSTFALFSLTQSGQELLDITGINATTAGAYSLTLFIAGDVNGDGNVDASDAQTLMQALGTASGQPGYVTGADANRDGVINSTDAALLAADLGFQATRPPTVTPAQATTHLNLAVSINLSPYASDPQGLPTYFRILNALDGQATLQADGHTVVFTPAAGYTGSATFQFQADDGYGTSAVATVSITISSAPLINLDFAQRNPRLNPGDVQQISVTGDFADQSGVVLPASYVTFQSSDPSVFSVTATGQLTAIGDGTAVLLVSTQGFLAATAVAVGFAPTNVAEELLYGQGLTTSLSAETLAAHIGSHQLDVSITGTQIDITPASSGTLYYVSNPQVIQVSPDGLVTAGADGTATITVINGPAEKVVPLVVGDPAGGTVNVGAAGAVVKGSDGSLVMVAPGSVTGTTPISISPVGQASLPMAVPPSLQFFGAFDFDTGGQTLAHPVQVVVPAPAGAGVGTKVYFYRAATVPDANGNPMPVWLESEVGKVEADGFVHTTSINDIVIPGTYIYGSGDICATAPWASARSSA